MLKYLAFWAAIALPSLAVAQVGTTPPPITINLVPPGSVAQGPSVVSVTLNSGASATYTSGKTSGVIGSVAVTTSNGSTYTGTASLSGFNTADFTLTNTSLNANSSTPTCTANTNYTFNIVATPGPGESGSAVSQQVTVSCIPSSTTIACDIGPSYTGTIPTPAQAAGFTHCAANYDFTQISSINDWLQCPDNGGTTANNGGLALLYQGDGSGHGSRAPCSDFNIINDGVNVFDLTMTPTDYDNTVTNSSAVTVSGQGNPTPNGTTFPTNAYIDQVWRWPSSTITSLGPDISNGQGLTVQALFMFSTNQYYGYPFIEWDFTEMGPFDGYSNSIGWDGASAAGGANYWANVSGFGNTTSESYHSYGSLIEVDSSGNESHCTYFDGTAINSSCSNGSTGVSGPNLTNLQNQRSPLVMFSSAWKNDPGFSRPSGNIDIYWKRITVWTCANWQTTGCTVSAVATTAP